MTNATSTEEHDHDEHDEHDEHDGHQHIHNDKVMLYCSIVLAGILLFLMLERVLEILCKFSLHAHNHHTLGEHEGDVVVEDVEGNIVKVGCFDRSRMLLLGICNVFHLPYLAVLSSINDVVVFNLITRIWPPPLSTASYLRKRRARRANKTMSLLFK